MLWTLFALLALVVLGGFISYYGDLQGRRWGKKRVSWFGMRPKHTAILITSLTGAFISLLSIITLLAISPMLRDVIWRGERAIRENRELSEAADGYRSEIKVAKTELYNAQTDKTRAEQEKAQKQAELAELQKRLLPLQQRVQQLVEQEARLRASKAQTEIALRQESAATLRYRNENEKLAGQNYTFAQTNRSLAQQKQQLEEQTRRLAKSNVDLSATNDALLATRDDLTKKNNVLANSNLNLLRANEINIEQINTRLETQRRELAVVTGQLERAREDLNYAENQLEGTRRYFTLTYDQVRRGRISVRSGGELARIVVDAHMSSTVVRAQLVKLLDDASQRAQALGAAKGQNGRAVLIVTQRVATQASEFAFGEEERLNGFVQALTGTDKPTVVIVSAFTNAIEGEPVIVDLQTNAAVPMFAAGKEIASCRLSANLSEEQIKEAIAQFLQTSVRAAAVKAGAIPEVDPASGINELGQLDPIDLGMVALRARQTRGDLILRAVARENITSADPLDRNHLSLELVRAPGTPKDG
jgi:uncharacterized protein (DUF3084 family)